MASSIETLSNNATIRKIIRWGLYPFSWAVVFTGFYFLFTSAYDPRSIYAISIGLLFPLYLTIEFLFPYERRWSMTFWSFIADLKYIAVNGIVVGALNVGLALFTIDMAGRSDGLASNWPVLLQVVCALLIFEACNYSMHRFMHEGRSKFGRKMWRMHAAHHLPPRLYLFMHAVFHPLNGLIIQTFAIVLPIWLMGYNEQAVVMVLMLNGMHGLLSHFNVDIRMGWMNYVFVGPELHRYHHSAKVSEAKNYGATLVVYDMLFGTFVYRPAQPPKALGVDAKSGLPPYEQMWRVLRLPFTGS